jgi:hypothetical protein
MYVQSKTIGIVTKCDLISAKALKELRRCVVTQDASVGSIMLKPFGYVCTMHDDVSIDGGKGEGAGDAEEDTSAQQQQQQQQHQHHFKRGTSNFSRLVRQDVVEGEWFQRAGCSDLLASGHAGSRAVLAKIDHMYRHITSSTLVPKVLLHIHHQREELQKQNMSLGWPLPPPACDEPAIETFKAALSCRVREAIALHKKHAQQAYAVEVLEPLLSSVLATSTGNIEFIDCLSPNNSVEKWLGTLRSKIRAMCANSVQKAKTFWREFVEKIFLQDESCFRVARFRGVITHIMNTLTNELDLPLVNLLASMDKSILQFLETVNLFQGVSVRYRFATHETVTLSWDSGALANSLVYHLTCRGVMLSAERLAEVAVAAVQTLGSDQCREQCAHTRASIHEDISVLEGQYRHILASLGSASSSSSRTQPDVHTSEEPTTSESVGSFCSQLKSSGVCLEAFLKHKFPVEYLRQGSFLAPELLAAGVPPTRLFKAGFSVQELRSCELNLSVLIGQAVLEKKTLSDMVVFGFTYRELEDFGYDFVLLLGAGCKKESKVQVLKALLLLDLSDEEKLDLNTRGLIPSLLLFWLEINPVVTEEAVDVVERMFETEHEGEDEPIKEDILRVFCKLFDGSIDVLRGITQHQVSTIASLVSGPYATASSCLAAIQSLRMLSNACEQNTGYIIETNILSSCLADVINQESNKPLQFEALVLLKNIGVNHSDQLLKFGYVFHLLQCLQAEPNNDTPDATRRMAAFVLYLLASNSCAMREISDQNGVLLLATYLSPVLALAETESDAAMNMILLGMSHISEQEGGGSASKECFMMDVVVEFLCEGLNSVHLLSHKEHVLATMHNLCAASSLHKKAFTFKGCAIKPLTELLRVSEHQLNEKAIKLLLLFVENSSEHKLAIAKAGGISLLIKMLDQHCTLASKLAATSLLIPLAAETANSIAIVEQGAVDLLLDMLYEESDACKEAAAATMRSLAFVAENRLILANDGAIDPLVSILREPASASSKVMAARTLRNLAFNCDDNKLAIANQGGITQLVAMLQPGHVAGEMGQIVATGVLQNLAYKIPGNVKLIVEADAMPLLAEILVSGGSAAREAAAGAVRNLATDDRNCVLAYRSGVLEALIGMHRTNVGACGTAARDALRSIAQNDMCRTNMKLAGIEKKDINYKSKNW